MLRRACPSRAFSSIKSNPIWTTSSALRGDCPSGDAAPFHIYCDGREAGAHIDHGKADIEIDEDVFERFRAHIEKKVKTRLPKFIAQSFKGYILSPHYESDISKVRAVGIETFDLETLIGIHKLEGIVEETPANSQE